MREYIVSHGVLCLFLATTFGLTGLLGLWAAQSRWSWYIRAALVIALLSPLLLRPLFDLLTTILAQLVVVVVVWNAHRYRQAIWAALRGRQRLRMPQFPLSSFVAATSIAAVAVAIVVAMFKQRDRFSLVHPLQLGAVLGVTTLFAAWWVGTARTWKSRIASLILFIPLSYSFQKFNYLYEAAPITTFWPYEWGVDNSPELVIAFAEFVCVAMIWVIQCLLVVVCSRAVHDLSRGRSGQRSSLVLAVLTLIVTAAVPAYVIGRLQSTCAIPQQVVFSGDDAAFHELLDLANQFKTTQLWRELCKDPIDNELLVVAVSQESHRYQKLHSLLRKPVRRPLSIEWMFDVSDPGWYAAQRAHSDDTERLGTLFYVLDAQGDTAQREKERSTSIESGLALIQLAETTFRGVNFSDYLRADNYSQSGMEQIYSVLDAMDQAQCEHSAQKIKEYVASKPPIEMLQGYERAAAENGYGWTGHLMRILGDLVNRIDPSLDANLTGILRSIDARSRTTAQLLLIELSLRKHYLSTGSYPQDLFELASFNHPDRERVVYQLREDGYLLYNFGVDGDDDAGRPADPNWYGAPENLRGDGDLQLKTHFADDPTPQRK